MLVLSCTVVLGSDDPTFTKVYENSKGVVTFNHTLHSENIPDCKTCHVIKDVPLVVNKDFGHDVCKACHKNQINNDNAPTKCNGCHVK